MREKEELAATATAAMQILHSSGCSPHEAAMALVCTLAALLSGGEQPPPEMQQRMSRIFWRLRLAKLEKESPDSPVLN